MKKYLKKMIGMVILTGLVCTGCSPGMVAYKRVDTAMGTIVNQTIYVSSDKVTAEEISQEIFSCIDDLEYNTLSWRLETSEVYRINECAGNGQRQGVSDSLNDILVQCKKVYVASDGAFDFTIGSVARLWNIDAWAGVGQGDTVGDSGMSENIVLPEREQIEKALTNTGADRIDMEGGLIALPEGMQLDLGAVGKGIALDEIEKILEQKKLVSGAVISVGGSILTFGTKPDGSLWKVGIVDPFATEHNIGILSLPGGFCVSTSGDYERFVEIDGVRYHHILDPHTGMPADSGVKSVTIVCRKGEGQTAAGGLFSDALSTACFVLGVEKGLDLANSLGAEALFVDEQGHITMTEGMNHYFYLSNEGK